MTEHKISMILSLPNAAIVAPAGHGKTEMIVDLVEHTSGKQLLLTHTNAGVDALEKRLKKRNISKARYNISTIAAFCIRWCMSYNKSAEIDMSLSPLNGKQKSSNYYEQIYKGAKRIFTLNWAGNVLKASYTGIIVDEYQDCTQDQHEIILAMNQFLPVRVLGDPLQGIFSFAGNLVNWSNLAFQRIEVETKPWRWMKTKPILGDYLTAIRAELTPALSGQSCNFHLDFCQGGISIINPEELDIYNLLRELKKYSTVVYITKWEAQQGQFCKRLSGVFQYDEKQDCEILYDSAKYFDENKDFDLALAVIGFVSKCATNVNAELQSYISNLKANKNNFSRIKKHANFGHLINSVCIDGTHSAIINTLKWFESQDAFKFYRKELYLEMLRSLRYANEKNTTVFEAANHIRKDSNLQKRYNHFKFLASRTLLSKGLEFDCVIIDMSDPLSARDFYVALTRAQKKIYIISNSADFSLTN